MRIPSIYHLIRFCAEGKLRHEPFSLTSYLAIASCVKVNRPALIRFYFDEEPWGVWWELARPHLELVPMRAPREIRGRALGREAHQSDAARLEILLDHGGIYLDLDVICLRPFLPLQNESVVMGEEQGVGLCNAVILARKGAPFLRRWLDAYADFDKEDWNTHSVRLPALLAREQPGEVKVLDDHRFFWPMYWPQHLEKFFRGKGSSFCSDSYCVHLWTSLSHEYLDEITPRTIWEKESEFCVLARRFLDRVLAYAATDEIR
jgi:hypothetical protein